MGPASAFKNGDDIMRPNVRYLIALILLAGTVALVIPFSTGDAEASPSTPKAVLARAASAQQHVAATSECSEKGEPCRFSNDCCGNLYCIERKGDGWTCRAIGDWGVFEPAATTTCCVGACNCVQSGNCCGGTACDAKSGDCK